MNIVNLPVSAGFEDVGVILEDAIKEAPNMAGVVVLWIDHADTAFLASTRLKRADALWLSEKLRAYALEGCFK